MSGKGSKRRRAQVSDDIVTQNWEVVFGKKNKMENEEVTNEEKKKELPEDENQ